MGSIETEVTVMNGDSNNDEVSENVNKLHHIVEKLAKENDLPSPTKQKYFPGSQENSGNDTDPYSLENTTELSEFECDTDLESEDSWLFESPQKVRTPGQIIRSPDKWLKENITTPELMRIRGSLSAKLDVIAIENRKGRMTDPGDRKRAKDRAESIMSVNSLDWDYDEDEVDLNGLSYNDNDFDPEAELRSYQGRDRQAWSEPTGRMQTDPNDPRPFSLDWSEDEDDLVPMKIDFNASQQGVQKRMVAPNPTVMKRGSGGSGINSLATPRQAEVDYDDLVAKPQGGVKPRRAVQPMARAPKQTSYNESEDITDYGEEEDFDDSAPVVPRGAVKPRGYDQEEDFDDSAPVVPRGAVKPRESASPRAVGIAKPVQRRKPENEGEGEGGAVRVRTSASPSNLVRPRTAPSMNKASSASDVSVVRRRGAPSPSEGVPAIRRSKEQPQIARVQGIPQVRKSTGSIPQKSGEGIARPRTGQIPSGMVRPRGSGMATRSYQADY